MEKETKDTETPQFSTEQLKGWEDYRSSIYDQQTKSHDSFEKAMTFLSSGALGLTLAFHNKIVPIGNAQAVFVIALGWLFLALTLYVNLISHYLSSKSLNKSADEIDKVITYEMTFEDYNDRLEERNNRISKLNETTIWFLGVGLSAVIIYVIINIYNGEKTELTAPIKATGQTTTKNEKLQSERTFDTTTNLSIK